MLDPKLQLMRRTLLGLRYEISHVYSAHATGSAKEPDIVPQSRWKGLGGYRLDPSSSHSRFCSGRAAGSSLIKTVDQFRRILNQPIEVFLLVQSPFRLLQYVSWLEPL